MKNIAILLAITISACTAPNPELVRWETMAEDITIKRDDWGIAHVHGPTDAHAVFGMIYAQAEDDFNRIEVNFLNSQGRLAEAEGEEEIWRDLRMRLFINPIEMQAIYAESPGWLRSLMDAWADGLNYYLHTHPEVAPRVLDRFEPWMALTFSEGSIGGDIERINIAQLRAFYDTDASGDMSMASLDIEAPLVDWEEPRGSNGIAIAPENTVNGNALFLINPHTSFFFRSELHMSSDEGLNAYGASTWGQFFIYQGFNEDVGWMHTSSGVDNIDEFLETVTERGDEFFYSVDGEERPLSKETVSIAYKSADGMKERDFTIFRSHHGPIVRAQGSKWVATSLMEEPMSALMQSYGRTKARGMEDYRENMEMHTNSSNNTVYADSDGNIAYWHSNFVPKRNPDINWLEPVDGSVSANDWGEPHSIEETPNVFNPSVGWIQNTNNWPYSSAGPDSPKQSDFAPYFQRSGENARGIHAIRLLENKKDFTLESLVEAAFSSQIPGFEAVLPSLLEAWENAPSSHPLKAGLTEQITELRSWDYRWGLESVATSLATYWVEELTERVAEQARNSGMSNNDYIANRASVDEQLTALETASNRLTEDFGTWETPWGEINRFQRINGDIVQPFSDSEPSIGVGFHSGRWGSLASFGARRYPGTVRRYGTSGNSFVAVVEFGEKVRALAVTAGGESGDPSSPHFNDQAQIYADGNLRPVYYYPEDLEGHIEREYKPGN
mgnify:FL=1